MKAGLGPTAVLAAVAALGAAAVGLTRSVVRVAVEGDSMRPALLPGDHLLVLRRLPLHPGDTVAAPDPRAPWRLLVKRVQTVGSDGVHLRGDVPSASTDSRHFGPVPASTVVGRVVWRYAPLERAGPVRRHPPSARGGAGGTAG